jgi:hypothetical protein
MGIARHNFENKKNLWQKPPQLFRYDGVAYWGSGKKSSIPMAMQGKGNCEFRYIAIAATINPAVAR